MVTIVDDNTLQPKLNKDNRINRTNTKTTNNTKLPPPVVPRGKKISSNNNATIKDAFQPKSDSDIRASRAKDVVPEMIPGKVQQTPKIDDVEAGKELGKGAFGTVSIAKNKQQTPLPKDDGSLNIGRLQKTFVLKDQLHNLEYSDIPSWKQAINNELNIQRQAKGAVPVIDEKEYQDKNGVHHQVMMPHGGQELAKITKSPKKGKLRPIPEATCRTIVSQLMPQLADLHKQGIVHRDIKLENVLINHQGKATLADFGVSQNSNFAGSAQGADDLKFSGSAGTISYMAPETYNSDSITHYSEKADCWSMGIMIAELLTGIRHPVLYMVIENSQKFDPKQHAYFLKYINNHPKLSIAAKELITAMLQQDPKQRPSAQEILEMPFFKNNTTQNKGGHYELQLQHQQKFHQLAKLEQNLEDTLVKAKANPNTTIATEVKNLKWKVALAGNEVKILQEKMTHIDLINEMRSLGKKIKKKIFLTNSKDIHRYNSLELDVRLSNLNIKQLTDNKNLELKYQLEAIKDQINNHSNDNTTSLNVKQLKKQAQKIETKLKTIELEKELATLNTKKNFYQDNQKILSKAQNQKLNDISNSITITELNLKNLNK